MSAEIDYTPMLDGTPYDPEPNGGEVSLMQMYGNSTRTGVASFTAGPADRVREGLYRFTIPDAVPNGRYWTTVTWTKAAAESEIVDNTGRIDLPFYADLIVSPEEVATRLGVALPISAAQRERLLDAIYDAQADVQVALNRDTLLGQQVQLTGLSPASVEDLYEWRAWPQASHYLDDRITVLAFDENPTGSGTYDVDFLVGVDGRSEEPLRRYVRAHAAEQVRLDPGSGMGTRVISSISTEGQSVSYEQSKTGPESAGQAGHPPNIKSLNRYKRMVVRKSRTSTQPPWPYRDGVLLSGVRVLH